MRMTAGMDEGEIMSVESIGIDPTDTSGALFAKFAEISGAALVRTLREHYAGHLTLVPQDHPLATYTRKILKEDGLLRYDAPAKALHDRVRALSPWPGAYDFFMEKMLRFDRTDWVSGDFSATPGTVIRLDVDGVERIGIATPDGCLILEAVTIE
jgi:methionyl-tRNA formyltransferase